MPAEKIVGALIEKAEPGIRDNLSGGDAERLLALLRSCSLLELLAFASSRKSGAESSFERSALERLAAQRGIVPEHVDAAWELVRTGRLGDDLAGVTAVSVHTLRSLPGAVTGFMRNPSVAIDVIPALFSDLAELPRDLGGTVARGVRDLFRGESPKSDEEHRERLLENTLRELYEVAPIDVVRSWGHEVTGHDSVKLAIIVYASTHGVNLEDDDIDAARAALGEGDLAPLLIAGFEYFQREAPDKLDGFIG
jgi:hypothetical protein